MLLCARGLYPYVVVLYTWGQLLSSNVLLLPSFSFYLEEKKEVVKLASGVAALDTVLYGPHVSVRKENEEEAIEHTLLLPQQTSTMNKWT